ncbi:hypothetical protein D043_3523A, partial [Vibrio parahaemolyticus EKP-021]
MFNDIKSELRLLHLQSNGFFLELHQNSASPSN